MEAFSEVFGNQNNDKDQALGRVSKLLKFDKTSSMMSKNGNNSSGTETMV